MINEDPRQGRYVVDSISELNAQTIAKYPEGTAFYVKSDKLYILEAGALKPSGIGYCINVQALTSSPVDAQTIYFGTLPKAPVTTAGQSKIYIRKAGTIKIAEIYCFSGTAGTAEAWSLSIRKNNTTDTLVATVSAATAERVFSKADLSISVVAGDYIEIKMANPTWVTNPLTTILGGYIYIE